MRSKIFILVLIASFFCVVGCETAKGFKKDMKNTWENLKVSDDWFKENLW